jgi:hypothetical protein
MKIKARNFDERKRVRKFMEDKELKKKLKRIPDADKNGDPIYKIAIGEDTRERRESPKRPDEKKD